MRQQQQQGGGMGGGRRPPLVRIKLLPLGKTSAAVVAPLPPPPAPPPLVPPPHHRSTTNTAATTTTTTTTTSATAAAADVTTVSNANANTAGGTASIGYSYFGTQQLLAYAGFVSTALILWVVYLYLPKGIRRQYFGATGGVVVQRRRQGQGQHHQQHNQKQHHPQFVHVVGGMRSVTAATWGTEDKSSIHDSVLRAAEERRMTETARAIALRERIARTEIPSSTVAGGSTVVIHRDDSRDEESGGEEDDEDEFTNNDHHHHHHHASDRYIYAQSHHHGLLRNRSSSLGYSSATNSNRQQYNNYQYDGSIVAGASPYRSESTWERGSFLAAAASSPPPPPPPPPPHELLVAKKAAPSPEHPALARIPEAGIINETMSRLKGRGIRLTAHGVQCVTKRVWVRLDEEQVSLTWQTEFPKQVKTTTTTEHENDSSSSSPGGSSSASSVNIVLMRGALHRIPLPNVLYIDVGKKTSALLKGENKHVPHTVCFSFLTQTGSLDLQANSKLERDALVCCFSLMLDRVHTQDWRKLYVESPDPSQVLSVSAAGGGGGTATTPSSSSYASSLYMTATTTASSHHLPTAADI